MPGPIPAYSNVPIHAEYYQPKRFVIEDITLGATTTITTTEDNDYSIGQLVRLLIPPEFGCRQLNEVTGYVVDIPADDQVVINIYSSGGNQFISASSDNEPQIIAIGDVNSGQINANGRINNGTYVPGSFINISPQ